MRDNNNLIEAKKGDLRKVKKLIESERLIVTVIDRNHPHLEKVTWNVYETAMFKETKFKAGPRSGRYSGKVVVSFEKLPRGFDLDHWVAWMIHSRDRREGLVRLRNVDVLWHESREMNTPHLLGQYSRIPQGGKA